MSSPVEPEHPGPVGDVDEETERLVALLIERGISEKVAQGLVRDFPERIGPQVEAHKHRSARNAPGLLVTAIRENYPIMSSQTPPSDKDRREEARKGREAERQAALDANAVENARKRAEEAKVATFWDELSPEQKDAFEEEAIEASPHRDEIRSLSHCHPLHRGFKIAARRDHVRRKLGLGVEG